jgi:hypothetical protein
MSAAIAGNDSAVLSDVGFVFVTATVEASS